MSEVVKVQTKFPDQNDNRTDETVKIDWLNYYVIFL